MIIWTVYFYATIQMIKREKKQQMSACWLKGAYLKKWTTNHPNNMDWPLYLSHSVSLCSGGWRSRSHSPAVSWERLGGQPVPTRHRACKSTLRTGHFTQSVSGSQWLEHLHFTEFIVGIDAFITLSTGWDDVGMFFAEIGQPTVTHVIF